MLAKSNLLTISEERDFSKLMIDAINCSVFLTDTNSILYYNYSFDNSFYGVDIEDIDFSNETHIIYNRLKEPHTFKIINTSNTHNGRPIYILKDISKEIEQEKLLNVFLHLDSLTGLPNRSKLINDLKNSALHILSLAIIDLKDFKEINDFYGNQIGDFILKSVANFIQSMLGEGQSLYKFHADTYCIANSTLNQEEFTSLVQYILEKIDEEVFHYDQYEIDTRAIAGISFSSQNNKLITADLALQSAKKSNKNYLVFYDELDNIEEYKNNMTWTKKLKTALAEDKIVVYFQPLVDNKTLRVAKYECLVRMIDENKIISPFFFLDIAKKTNQYTKLTKVVIQKAFMAFEYLSFDFSVNVSYDDIEDETFIDFIKQMILKYNAHDIAKRVVFEILEDQSIKNYDILSHFIKEVKALGCKVAIDDFGSGYSNFEHIIKMNVDYLKIDASLIKNIVKDENSYKVTKTIVDFAKSLNLKTIAEYVESEEIFNITKDLGIDYSQGYYFSPPISSPELESC
ncbi:EAL domain-containing protein [Arcobacter sp. FWKO B]|uniref:EAL domain-containing protein n=1 Tax=Arcobacter sp. FWKO B TaxID=2593672 RepID=UPI0018A58E4E|nr:bifunctional diguanylate cyclase/phosphodiesterase [Arcobacter sp. FWKO B]QOG13171.1 bifunctional diguanylate cyclase/phosphodiesterase [Arcobacter sp. FWKO B]